jgi:hypothetical protein
MMELFVRSLVKSLDIPTLLAQLYADPRTIDALALLRRIADDFEAIKAGQARINARLDKIEARGESAPVMEYKLPGRPIVPVAAFETQEG